MKNDYTGATAVICLLVVFGVVAVAAGGKKKPVPMPTYPLPVKQIPRQTQPAMYGEIPLTAEPDIDPRTHALKPVEDLLNEIKVSRRAGMAVEYISQPYLEDANTVDSQDSLFDRSEYNFQNRSAWCEDVKVVYYFPGQFTQRWDMTLVFDDVQDNTDAREVPLAGFKEFNTLNQGAGYGYDQ